jgi:hypothetical protein
MLVLPFLTDETVFYTMKSPLILCKWLYLSAGSGLFAKYADKMREKINFIGFLR